MDENALRLEVATCCRLAEYIGLFDFSGHASARIQGEEAILINSRDSVRSNITAKDIIKVDLEGATLEEGAAAPSEVHIHTAIYRQRPDVHAVIHLHSPAVIALSVVRKEIIPVISRGAFFAEGVPVYDDSRNIYSPDRGKAVASALGRQKAVIMRGHGSVVAAESLKAVLFYGYFLELNAQNQLAAYQAGLEPYALREEEIMEKNCTGEGRFMAKVWDYYVHKAGLLAL